MEFDFKEEKHPIISTLKFSIESIVLLLITVIWFGLDTGYSVLVTYWVLRSGLYAYILLERKRRGW